MFVKTLKGVIVGGFLLLNVSSPSVAAIVYNNLGPDDSYNPNIGWGVRPHLTPSMQFATTGSGLFSQLAIAVGNEFDSTMTVYLQSDNNGVPGAILETLSFLVEDRFGSGGLQVISAAGTTFLTENTWYWLTGLASTNFGWYWNNTGAAGYTAYASEPFGLGWNNVSVQTLSAFRIEVADPMSVPEPALGGWLVIAPFIAAAATRRRLRA
jgi:hypothetical protein